MRILRSSLFSPDLSALTTVVRDSDVRDTLESIRVGARQPGMFLASDIFDTDGDVTIEVATDLSMKRWKDLFDIERNQAIQFYWATMQFQLVSRDGTVIMPQPAPFSTARVVEVFEQIAKHPDYTNQTLVATSDEAEIVTLKNGKVTV